MLLGVVQEDADFYLLAIIVLQLFQHLRRGLGINRWIFCKSALEILLITRTRMFSCPRLKPALKTVF